jgi:hypothetical protein
VSPVGRRPSRVQGSVRLAGAGIIIAAFVAWAVRTCASAVAVSPSATRHSISDASSPTREDGVVLQVALRRQRRVRVQVARCTAEIRLLGDSQGPMAISPQVSWALTQTLRESADRNALASGDEVSYQASFRAPHDRAIDVKVVAFGAPAILQWIGWAIRCRGTRKCPGHDTVPAVESVSADHGWGSRQPDGRQGAETKRSPSVPRWKGSIRGEVHHRAA